jgi:Na+/H+-dicarboxylate symporter
VTGVASLSDLKKLSRIGGKTIIIYVGTTAIAVTLGLLIVNVLKPGTPRRSEVLSSFSWTSCPTTSSPRLLRTRACSRWSSWPS